MLNHVRASYSPLPTRSLIARPWPPCARAASPRARLRDAHDPAKDTPITQLAIAGHILKHFPNHQGVNPFKRPRGIIKLAVRPQPLHPSTCPTARPPFRDRCLSSAPPGPPRLPSSPVTRSKMHASVSPPGPSPSVPPARISLSPRPASVLPPGPHHSVPTARINPSHRRKQSG